MQTVFNPNGVAIVTAFNGYLFGSQTIITATGASTYTVPVGCKFLYIEAVAGGGAGGGPVNSSAGQITVGAGGNSGTYSSAAIAVYFPTLQITVGAAASQTQVLLPVALGSQNIVNCTAGGAGNVVATGTTNVYVAASNTSGAAANGSVRAAGNAGGAAQRVSGTVAISGAGAHGPWGGGGAAIKAQGNGNPGNNYGAGGSGGMSVNAGGAASGGAGAQGIVIISEYY